MAMCYRQASSDRGFLFLPGAKHLNEKSCTHLTDYFNPSLQILTKYVQHGFYPEYPSSGIGCRGIRRDRVNAMNCSVW